MRVRKDQYTPAAEAYAPLSVTLFGGTEARIGGEPLRRLRTRQGYRLLALLALREGQEWDRLALAARLWPDSASDAAALALLRRALTDLRAALGPEAHRLRSPAQAALRLDLSGEAFLDVRAFDAALDAGDDDGRDCALALYRGPLLPDLDDAHDPDGTVRAEREGRHQRFLDALESRARRRREDGDAEGAAADLRRLLALEPLRESASLLLLETVAASGDRAGALAEYERLRRRLARELHTEPNARTRAAHDAIRAGRDAPAATAMEATARAMAATPGRGPGRPTRGLPHALTSFIGRERQITKVGASLETTRLLTLTGPGGAGKTRLALRVAETVRGAYPDGVRFVELAPLTDPSLVPHAVAAALDLRERSGETPIETLTDALRDKRLLLVLDNAEHLRDACAHLASGLLRACPGLRMLVTGREPLGLTGELLHRVPPLSLPGTGRTETATPADLERSEAARLFVERARFVRPGFTTTEANAPVIARLCRRLDGLPLAIELAAARVRSLGVEQIDARLGDRFRLLTGGDRAAPPRQRTLRALIDWSWDLLDGPERTLLARLSVFSGGWTLSAAERVCGFGGPDADAVLDTLASLVDKSLVVAEAGEATPEARYRMLETVRLYASERLAASPAEATESRRRHRDWCVALAEEAEAHLTGPEPGVWLDRLEREHDNLRAALSADERNHPERDIAAGKTCDDMVRLRLTAALWRFWQMRGYLSEGRAYTERALAREDRPQVSPEAKRVTARARGGAGILASGQGDYAAAHAHQEESLRLYREIGDERGAAEALGRLGLIAFSRAEYAPARTHLEESLSALERLGERRPAALALNNLGHVAAAAGEDPETVRSLYARSLVLFRALDDRQGIAYVLNSLGGLAHAQGDLVEANDLLQASLRLLQDVADLRGIAYGLESMAALRADLGDPAAAALWAATAALRRSLGAPLPSAERATLETRTDEARTSLGVAAWEVAWAEGEFLRWEEAVARALVS